MNITLLMNSISKSFNSNVSEYNLTVEKLRKIYLINIFNLIAFIFTFSLGIHALYLSMHILAFILLFVSIILVANYFYLKVAHKINIASGILSSLFFMLFLYLVYTGGVDRTGPLWIYPLPMIIMFLLGLRQGIIYMTLFFIAIIFILFGLDSPLYSDAFKLRIVLSLFLVTFLASIYEYLGQKRFESMKVMSKQLEEASNKDHLTQVYNRRGIHKKLENTYRHHKTDNKNFSLMLCDIDYFKKINDNFGHEAGDKVLKIVARKIENIIRKEDIVSRWGGEEFLVLLPNTSIEAAYEVGEKIRKSIENISFKYGEHNITMTVSIGIAEKENGLSITEIINKADTNMYVAKKEGRNTVYPKYE